MIRRTRTCKNPVQSHVFETSETASSADYLVERKSGRIEPFDQRNALERSIRLATANRIQGEAAAEVARAVITRLNLKPRTPVPTKDIGLAVIDELATRSIPGALRFAMIFLSARGVVTDPQDLLEWLHAHFPAARTVPTVSMRPTGVVKRPRSGHAGIWFEDFEIMKLWRGLSICTHGLEPASTVTSRPHWDVEEFIGAIIAFVFEKLRGQQLVTGGQISGAILEILRAVCPFAFMRFSIVAKGYDRKETFIEELQGLTEFPSPPFDLDAYYEAGAAVAREVASLRKATG